MDSALAPAQLLRGGGARGAKEMQTKHKQIEEKVTHSL